VPISVEARDPRTGAEAMKAFLVVPRRKAVGFVRSAHGAEKMTSGGTSVARKSSDDFTTVLTFSLLGLALSLLAIGKVGFIDANYMAYLLLLF
jgi:hypothetical protein